MATAVPPPQQQERSSLSSVELMKPVARDASSLYGLLAVQMLFPLILMPFLARSLGAHSYGILLLLHSVAIWTGLVVEYGFNIYATREIARDIDDKQAVQRIASEVVFAKLALSLLGITLGAAYVIAVPSLRALPPIYWLATALAALGSGNSLTWFFQGTGRLAQFARVEVISRVFVAVLILLSVRGAGDEWIVLLLYGLGSFAAFGVLVRRVHSEIRISVPAAKDVAATLRKGFSLFVNKIATTGFTTLNVVLMGLLAPASQVAFFAGAERIINYTLMLLSPLSQALYPRMSNLMSHDEAQAQKLSAAAWAVMLGAAAVLAGTVYLAAPILVSVLLGSAFEAVVPVLRVCCLLVPLHVMNTLLGIQWLIPKNREATCNAIYAIGTLVNIGLAIALVTAMGPIGMALSVVTTLSLIVLSMAASALRIKAIEAAIRQAA